MDDEDIKGRVALVTGASRGIGRATAILLAHKGARVALNYRSDERAARSTAEAIGASGAPDPFVVRADVGRPRDVEKMIAQVEAELGAIDLVVNNAGLQRSNMLHKMSDADWTDVLDVNLSGVFYVSRAVLPSMRRRGFGRIVNIASASSEVAQPGVASYVAAKHGLIGLTKVMALENAAKGILVNAVAPGLTDTDMVRSLDGDQRAQLERLIPLRRMATSEEVAKLIVMVLSGATYSTGNVFHASGGVAMG